ncbi:hypothetical protein ATY27_13700 [Rheinheimera sp. F8]|nr:hypothetical protein ATY27_13700 [Rheinheimera sp. F8]
MFSIFKKKPTEPPQSRRFQLASPAVKPAFKLTGTLMELEIVAPADWLEANAEQLQRSVLQHQVPFLANREKIQHWLRDVLNAIDGSWPESLRFAFVLANQQVHSEQIDLKQLADQTLLLATLWPELERARLQFVMAAANFCTAEIPLHQLEWQGCLQALHHNAQYLTHLSRQIAHSQQQAADLQLGAANAMEPIWLEHRQQADICLQQLVLLMDKYTQHRLRNLTSGAYN